MNLRKLESLQALLASGGIWCAGSKTLVLVLHHLWILSNCSHEKLGTAYSIEGPNSNLSWFSFNPLTCPTTSYTIKNTKIDVSSILKQCTTTIIQRSTFGRYTYSCWHIGHVCLGVHADCLLWVRPYHSAVAYPGFWVGGGLSGVCRGHAYTYSIVWTLA